MRRVFFVILTALIVFAGCAEHINNDSRVSIDETNSEYSSTSELEDTSFESSFQIIDNSNITNSEYSSTSELEDTSFETSFQIIDSNITTYPLLFIDTTDTINDKAYVLCAFNEERMYSTHEFLYNDKRLLDFVLQQDMLVESNIIDTTKDFVFYDNSGNKFETDCEKLFCYGVEIIDEVHVCTNIKSEIKSGAKRYLGTYSDINIFPTKVEYAENLITVDLDSNGVADNVCWTLSLADGEYDGERYYYALDATINGKKVSVTDNNDWAPLAREDLEVFIADVDMDGVFEIVIYEKAASRFNNVFIYKVDEESGKFLYGYTITPEP